MKWNVLLLRVTLLVFAAFAVGRRGLEGEDKVADVSLRGTVVDMHCYVTHGTHNADHTACANACIARGVPAGFLAEDGTLYVLFGQEPFSVKEQVKDLADVPILLTGAPVVRNGVTGIQIKKIEKTESGGKP